MKVSQFFSAFLIVSLILSCSSDDDDDMLPPPDETVTYANSIKGIIDANCTSCHGDPTTNGAPMSLITAAQVESSVRTRNLIVRVENGSMPPVGGLSASQIQAIKDWQASGFQ